MGPTRSFLIFAHVLMVLALLASCMQELTGAPTPVPVPTGSIEIVVPGAPTAAAPVPAVACPAAQPLPADVIVQPVARLAGCPDLVLVRAGNTELWIAKTALGMMDAAYLNSLEERP